MKRPNLASMSVAQLVERFGAICVEQYKHLRHDEIERYNQSFDDLVAINDDLKARPGDRRNALLPLLGHQNPQVRLKAALYSLAVAPVAARRALEVLREDNEFPQAAYAHQTLTALDEGTSRLS